MRHFLNCFRWAFTFLVIVLCVIPIEAQRRHRPPPQYFQAGPPDAAIGREILSDLRRLGVPERYYAEFRLRDMPRDTSEVVRHGVLWGGRGHDGTNFVRIHLFSETGSVSDRLLLQGGLQGQTWQWQEESAESVLLTMQEAGIPLAGTQFNLLDLQMPFLFWDDYVYEGITRFRGRPTNVLLVYPPPEETWRGPTSAIRLFVDSQFRALTQTQWLGANGQPERTVSALQIRRVDGQWMVSGIDARCELNRDKTRFELRRATTAFWFPEEVFLPERLWDDDVPRPEPSLLHTIH